jgi:hypothetical protein
VPGEVWRVEARAGKETVAGTAVTPTRRLYWDALVVSPERESRPIRVAKGTRDNIVGHTQGPFQVGGSFTTRIAPGELDEVLEMALRTGVTSSVAMGGTLARERAYTPGTTASATIEFFDGAQNWRCAGAQVNSLTLDGSVDGETTLSAEIFASDFVSIGSLTGTVTERPINFLEGWQGTFSLADFGSSTYTAYPDLVQTYGFTLGNNLGRVYTLNDTLAANRVSVGLLDVTANLGIDATGAFADDIVVNWRTDVKQVLKLEFLGPANGIETGQREMFRVEIPGAWTSPDMGGENQGVRSYGFPFQFVYDPALGAGIRMTTRNARPASGAGSPWL